LYRITLPALDGEIHTPGEALENQGISAITTAKSESPGRKSAWSDALPPVRTGTQID
jgi:hypothetical protein